VAVLHVDIETYSDIDLKKAGVYRYVESPEFRIILCAYALDDEPVKAFDHIDPWLMDMLTDARVTKVAHNAAFEFTCFSKFVPNLNISQWECTSIMCGQQGLPGSLDAASTVLKLAERKDARGRALIRLFSMPNKGRRVTPQEEPKEWQEYIAYNKQDVEVERALHKKLGAMTDKELYIVDHKINKRGVAINGELAKQAISVAEYANASAYERLKAATCLDYPTDAAIKKRYGLESLTKDAVKSVGKERPELSEILKLRGILSTTSVKKYEAMLGCQCQDGRARGLTQFYGAGRTGRWAGRLIQLQNLPRIKMEDRDLETARNALLSGDRRLFNLLYDDGQLDALAQLIRTALVPRPGCKFIVADFSAIEARVLAWLANEKWRLDVFNGDGRIYEASAERMFNLPAGSIDKSTPEGAALRQKGKVAELALGYGGGAGALTAMGALSMGIDEAELPKLVRMWRNANPGVVDFWKFLDKQLYNALVGGHAMNYMHFSGVHARKRDGVLRLALPNGRELTYRNAFWDDTGNIPEARYYGQSQTTNQWCLQDLYGAKATENVVQAIARDCLAEVLIYAEHEGFNPVFHVHDEIICEVPEGIADNAYEALLARMAMSPQWAPGLPLKGDGFVCGYYSK
jgi:DNA polymerase